MANCDADPPTVSERATDTPSRRLDPTWFERAVEAAGHAIFITNATGRIVYVNPAFESITGYDAADAVGRTPTLLNSGCHPDGYFRRLWETIRGGEVWREEIINRRADGDRYVANQTIAPIGETGDGTMTHFVSIQTDITERRDHEQALERSRDLSARTESTADVGGWELDVERNELLWTVGTRRIHGVEASYEPSLEDALSFYHRSDRGTVRAFVERALDRGVPYDVEARLVTADGETRTVRTTGQLIERETGPVLRGTIQDITEQTTRRQQLTVFNSVLRHNLRNGLNVVMGHAEQVIQALESAERSDETIDRARDDARHIVSVAEDLNGTSTTSPSAHASSTSSPSRSTTSTRSRSDRCWRPSPPSTETRIPGRRSLSRGPPPSSWRTDARSGP